MKLPTGLLSPLSSSAWTAFQYGTETIAIRQISVTIANLIPLEERRRDLRVQLVICVNIECLLCETFLCEPWKGLLSINMLAVDRVRPDLRPPTTEPEMQGSKDEQMNRGGANYLPISSGCQVSTSPSTSWRLQDWNAKHARLAPLWTSQEDVRFFPAVKPQEPANRLVPIRRRNKNFVTNREVFERAPCVNARRPG
jgi:hypothetical protein